MIAGSQIRARNISELINAQAILYNIRDLNPDLKQGVINVSEEIIKKLNFDNDKKLSNNITSEPQVQKWKKAELGLGKKYLQLFCLKYKSITDKAARKCIKPLLIDFIRFALPFSNIPFRSLYWGRLQSERSSIVLFKLNTEQKNLRFYLYNNFHGESVDVSVYKDNKNTITAMTWVLQPVNGTQLEIFAHVKQTLEHKWILDKSRTFWLIPEYLRQKMSSSGREEKCAVEAIINNEKFTGIMEEVLWHGN